MVPAMSRSTNMLSKIDVKTAKPVKEKPDAEVLAKLLHACEIYDMDGVDAAMAEIEKYGYEADEGLAAWLRERTDVTDFEAVARKLKLQ